MNPEVDINILMQTFTDRMSTLYRENVILDAKYKSLLKDYNEIHSKLTANETIQ